MKQLTFLPKIDRKETQVRLDMPDEIKKQGVVGKLPLSAIKRVQRFCVKSQPKRIANV
ncbi:hypothetical protein [Bacillus cereus group sp. BfR-BA-01383]|uniref:hypothetical protein n=1 Tax=Bacillus cereus group sp. BfR-BA-01383 TaxID=2920327 RepID=UPI001F570945|nr:hypothetical protein [Bacillus cereus group sp. BfR-BA-01383]